jgi:hypothetical protein
MMMQEINFKRDDICVLKKKTINDMFLEMSIYSTSVMY